MVRHHPRSALIAGTTALLLALPSRSPLHAAPGDPVGSEFQVNTYTTGAQYFPKVAPDGAGGFVVVWQSFGSGGTDTSFNSIQGQRFDATGAPVGGEVQVNTYTTDIQFGPSVAPDGAGGFVVVWASNGSSGTDTSGFSVQGRRYDSTGTPAGSEFQANTYTTSAQYAPAVAPDGAGGFVVVWQSFGSGGTDTSVTSIQGQRFDSTGVPTGGEFQVNTFTIASQRTAAVGRDGGGGFVVVWSSDGSSGTDASGTSIQGQRFDATGTPVGGEFQVNTHTTSHQMDPAVGPDGTGGFVVVWQSLGGSGTDTAGTSIQGQRYDTIGAPVGGEFQVNTYTTSDQRYPAVGPDDAGGFAVAWESIGSSGTDTDDPSVQGQRYDPAGMPVGGEFQVNTYTTGGQGRPSVAPDGAGGFVVVWESFGGSETDISLRSVQAQRFEGGTSTTTTATVTSTTTSTTLPLTIDTAITGRKLVIVDKTAMPVPAAKLVSVSKLDPGIQKGAPLSGAPVVPPGLTGAIEVTYTGCGPAAVLPSDPCAGTVPAAAAYALPADWFVNKGTVAKYVNRDAPAGAGHVKVAVVKPGKVAKVVARGLGEGPELDLVASGKPDPAGVLVVFTVSNALDGETYRMCTRYEQSAVAFKAIAADAGRKLVARGGVPAPCP